MPLAQTQRPSKLADFIGQPNLVGPGAPIRQMIESGNLSSIPKPPSTLHRIENLY
jgi:putative ATPase